MRKSVLVVGLIFGWSTCAFAQVDTGRDLSKYADDKFIDCWTPGYEKVGLRTHIWGAKWYDAERATCLYYREGKYYSQKFHKAKAGSVRCVAE